MNALRGFIGMPSGDKRVVLELTLRLVSAEIMMRFLPYSLTRKHVFRDMDQSSSGKSGDIEILRQRLIILKRICAHLPWQVTCLRKAVALRDSLSAAGVGAVIRIGVNKGKSSVNAHAWLECCGYEVLKNGTYSEFLPV
jgi:hypothetical protein